MQQICFVKNLTGRTIAFEIKSTDFVGKLVRAIDDREGIAPGSYHLFFGGTKLMADRTLRDYNIQTEPPYIRTLHIALRGGYGLSDFSQEQESWDRWLAMEGQINEDLSRQEQFLQIEANRLESQAGTKKSRLESQVENNTANISKNRAELFLAECEVMQNKTNAYLARSLVQENQTLIAKNYSSSFLGNRQLASQNTEDLFRNRYAIYRHLAVDSSNPVEVNFREAMTNRAKIEFLEHRSNLNAKMLRTILKMVHLNSQLIDINSEIMESNRGIIEFNALSIAKNSEVLRSGISAVSATPESNAAIITENANRITTIRHKAAENRDLVTTVQLEAESNRAKILANTDLIYDRRAAIVANSTNIKANQQAIAQFIGNI